MHVAGKCGKIPAGESSRAAFSGLGCAITLHKSRCEGGPDVHPTRQRRSLRTPISVSSADLSMANSDDANNFRCTELQARVICRCKSESLRTILPRAKKRLGKNKEPLKARAYRISPLSIAWQFSEMLLRKYYLQFC